jgi:hypothetical protein
VLYHIYLVSLYREIILINSRTYEATQKQNIMNAEQIKKLEEQAIELMKTNSTRSQGVNNKTILIELLTKGSYPRLIAPVKAATLFFTTMKQEPTEDEYKKKIISIKNSLDTLVSDYNNKDKVERDHLMNGTKLNKENDMLSIVKAKTK